MHKHRPCPESEGPNSEGTQRRNLPSRSTRPVGSLVDKQRVIHPENGPQLKKSSLHRKEVISLSSGPESNQSQPQNSCKRRGGRHPRDDSDSEDEPKTAADLAKERAERLRHKMEVHGRRMPCPQPDYDQITSASFLVDPDDSSQPPIQVKKGTWLTAKVETFGKDGEAFKAKEVALVLAVLQSEDGDVRFAVRWAWTWTSMFSGAEGSEALQNPKQIFLQRNHCITGNRDQGPVRVQAKDGSWVDTLAWEAVCGIANVRHRSQVINLQAFCKQSEDNYFYDKEFDNASWRVSQIGPVESATERPCKRLKPSELTMGDVFSGLGTVALASLSAGMQPQYCVEMDECAFNAASLNMNGRLKLDDPLSLAQFIQGIQEKRPGYPQRGDVAVLHLSPPCQSLSPANRTASLERVQTELYPILADCVKLVKLLRPKFVTVEEVPHFLVKRFSSQASDGKKSVATIHPGLRILAPLIDYGYQAQLTILNSLFYGVPQHRRRAFAFFALPDYELPLPPPARYYCDLFQNSLWVHGLFDTMRRDSMHWNAIYVTPHGTLESLKEATNTAGEAILDFEEAAKKMKETEDDDEYKDASRLMEPAAEIANPRRLRKVPTAAHAIEDLPVPKVADNKAQSHFRVPNARPALMTRFALFCRKPFVRESPMPFLEDHTIRSHHMLTSGDKPPNVLQRTLMSLKDAPHRQVGPAGVFSTVCTIPDARNVKGTMHYRELRLLTLAEKKRIQSIPDDVYLIGDEDNKARQVGNAVPFLLGRAVMDAVYQAATGRPSLPFPNVFGIEHDDGGETLKASGSTEEYANGGEPSTMRADPLEDDAIDERSSQDCAIHSPLLVEKVSSIRPAETTIDAQSIAPAPPAKVVQPVVHPQPVLQAKAKQNGWSWCDKNDSEEIPESGEDEREATSPEKPQTTSNRKTSGDEPEKSLPVGKEEQPLQEDKGEEKVRMERTYPWKNLGRISHWVGDKIGRRSSAAQSDSSHSLVKQEPVSLKKRERSSNGNEKQSPLGLGVARTKRRKHLSVRKKRRPNKDGSNKVKPDLTTPPSARRQMQSPVPYPPTEAMPDKEPASGDTVYEDVPIDLCSDTDNETINLD